MSKSLDDALGDSAWSVSAVVFDLNDMLDDEGRPISERRADAKTRVGVEMEMRQCPFAGIRHNKWMNVSALAQITQHYNAVLAEMKAFRRQAVTGDATWDDILAGVIDMLAGPAIYLLQQRNPGGPVPAQVAVGHKLAAGFFGVIRGLQERLALGADIPVTVDSFLSLVDETGALVGASEVCAGSPKMLHKTSTALIEGDPDSRLELDRPRLKIARCLALQVQIGIIWHLYDRTHLWSLILGEFREYLAPCNVFLQRKLEQAAHDIDALAPARPSSDALPRALDAQQRQRLAAALNDAADAQVLVEDVRSATELLNEPGSPIRFTGDTEALAKRVADYLHTHRLFQSELSKLERELRGHLGFPSEAPIRLGAAAFPTPQALPWYELILGRRLGDDGHLSGKSTKARITTSTGKS